MHGRVSVWLCVYVFVCCFICIYCCTFLFFFRLSLLPFSRAFIGNAIFMFHVPSPATPAPVSPQSAHLLRTYLYTIIFCSDFRTSLQPCAAPSSLSLFLSLSLCGCLCVRVSYRNVWAHIDIDQKREQFGPVQTYVMLILIQKRKPH